MIYLPLNFKKPMRRIFFIILATSMFVSCSKIKNMTKSRGTSGKPDTRGEIIPKESSKSFVAERPYGMVAIPGGSFVM